MIHQSYEPADGISLGFKLHYFPVVSNLFDVAYRLNHNGLPNEFTNKGPPFILFLA
jgi:hypothetical protein